MHEIRCLAKAEFAGRLWAHSRLRNNASRLDSLLVSEFLVRSGVQFLKSHLLS